MTASSASLATQPAPSRSIVFPLVLITIGAALLLGNFGYLSGLRWTDVLQLWPILLVLAGVDVMLRSRSFLAAAIVEIAIIVVTVAYLASGITIGPVAASYDTVVPRAGATSATLTVNYGAGALTLSGGGADLVSVRSTRQDVTRTVDQTGASAVVVLSSSSEAILGYAGRDRTWDITLPADVRTSMTLNLGAGDFDIDLSNIKVARATINAGASDLTVRLPRPSGDVPMTISTGMSSIQIDVPAGVAYRIEDTSVLGSLSGTRESSTYATATDRVTIKLSAAMSAVTIR